MKRIYLLSLTAFLLQSASSKAQIISTIAGGGAYDFTENQPANAVKLFPVWAITRDDLGNTYFTEPDRHSIKKIDISGNISTFAGIGTAGTYGNGLPATEAQLNQPYGIAADHNGNIFIADTKNNSIRKVNAAGVINNYITGISEPFDIAADDSGNIYYTMSLGNAVMKCTPTGANTIIANGFSTYLPAGPYGYTGDLWWFSNCRLSGIAVDKNGNVYIADHWDNVIRKITPDGTTFVIAGKTGLGNGGYDGDGGPADMATLNGPRRLTIDNAGNVIFSDGGNYRIRRIDTNGIINTIAGGKYGSGGDGGPAIDAAFSAPAGITTDANGYLYIADKGNNRVRKITPGGLGTTNIITKNEVDLFPTPCSTALSVKGTWQGQQQFISAEILDVTGRSIMNLQLPCRNGAIATTISEIATLTNGTYLLKLSSSNVTQTKTFTVAH
jgi:trimeric autotransporter adhesin